MAFTTQDDFNILQSSDNAIVDAGAGNDTYIISPVTLRAGQSIRVSDAEGVNTLQLADGLTITGSQLTSNVLQLTLSNDAVITVLGAAAFSFDVGGNAVTGAAGTIRSFADFARQDLGVAVPAADEGVVSGGTVVIGEGAPAEPETVSESEANDQFSMADAVTIGDTLTGTVKADGDADYFRFEADTGGDFDLAFTHPNGAGDQGALMEVALIDAEGNSISEREFRGDATLQATLDSPGAYFLRVTDATGYRSEGANGNAETGTYQIVTTLSTKADTAFDGADNDTLSHAVAWLADGQAPLTLGDSVSGSVGTSGDSDMFKLLAEQGGQVTLDFTHPNGVGGEGASMAVSLRGPEGNIISTRTFEGSATLNATLDQAGAYYLEVADLTGYASDGYNGDVEDNRYFVSTSHETAADTAYDRATNVSLAEAVSVLADGETSLTFGHALQGSMGAPDDSDVFKLLAGQGGQVTLDFTHPNGIGDAGATMTLSLVDAEGNVISQWETRGDTTLYATVDRAGAYYLRVEDNHYYGDNAQDGAAVEDGFYRVGTAFQTASLTAYDSGEHVGLSTAVATLADGTTALTFDHDIVGSMGADGDTDTFKLKAQATGELLVDFLHPNGPGSEGAGMDVSLYDERGEELMTTSFSGNGTLEATIQEGETYYLKVSDDTYYGASGINGDVEPGFYQVDFTIA